MKAKLSDLVNNIKVEIKDHDTQIMTGAGIVIMLAGAVVTGFASVRIKKKLDDIQKAEKNELKQADEEHPKLKKAVKIAKNIWPEVVVPVAIEAAGAGLLIKAESVNIGKIAEMTEGLKLTGIALSDATKYAEKAAEKLGDKVDSDIRSDLAKEKAENSRNDTGDLDIRETGYGGTLCFDSWSGRYFRCSVDRIYRAINDINNDMINEREGQWEAYRTLNDLYYEINLEPTRSGEILGWKLDSMNCKLLELRKGSILIDDMPCFVMDFSNPPEYLESLR